MQLELDQLTMAIRAIHMHLDTVGSRSYHAIVTVGIYIDHTETVTVASYCLSENQLNLRRFPAALGRRMPSGAIMFKVRMHAWMILKVL